MQKWHRGMLILVVAAGVNAGIQAGDDPCEKAGILVDGINDLADLPLDYTDGTETQFLEQLCLGYACDPMSCFSSQPFQWAEYTATCTQAVSLRTRTSDGDVGPASIVLPTCNCSTPAFGARYHLWWWGTCPWNHTPISFLTVPGKCYKFAIFGGESAVIEPLEDMTYICNRDYYWFGEYTGEFYDDVAAFVSCQSDCDSPTCSKCFDADEDGAVTLRDYAEFQNNAPW